MYRPRPVELDTICESMFQGITTHHSLSVRSAISVSVTVLMAFALLSCASEESQPADSEQAADSAKTSDKTLDKAPDFELILFGNEDHDAGETIKLSDYAGSPVVLNFWFPSCPPCVAEMPDFEAAYQKFKADGVEFIGVQLVGLDSVDDGQKFVNDLGVNYSLGPDKIGDKMGDIIMEYKISGFPTTVLIDRDGNIHRRWSGALNLEKLEELVLEIQ